MLIGAALEADLVGGAEDWILKEVGPGVVFDLAHDEPLEFEGMKTIAVDEGEILKVGGERGKAGFYCEKLIDLVEDGHVIAGKFVDDLVNVIGNCGCWAAGADRPKHFVGETRYFQAIRGGIGVRSGDRRQCWGGDIGG